jgi:tetratricopeptide (TPR) repeat protein
MAFPRQHLNATLLPDGKVLVTGGTRTQPFSNAAGAVLAAEMWDPTTETWTTLASMRWPRLHHSVAVLLPDGRVVVGGGGQPTGEGDSDHYDVEIFSPPYLFKGKRPKLTSAPAAVAHLYRGRALIGLRRDEEAEGELLTAVRLGGDEVKIAHRYLGAIYNERRDHGRAIAALETYLRLEPNAKDAAQVRQIIEDLRVQATKK